MDNILKGISEADRLIYNDEDLVNGFVILPDLKWNSSDLNSLYLVAIVRQGGLHSVRDLRREHVPLLRDIQQKGKVQNKILLRCIVYLCLFRKLLKITMA